MNRSYLLIAMGATILQFIIFKLLYPYPDFFSDSYSYLYAASANLDVNVWPIGYSKFLRAFHYLTSSDTGLIAFQYFFLELGALYFFYTILYFFHPSRNSRIILCLFLFFNPLFLYICNYVNSDPLFVALSILWFTQLLWIIYKPAFYQIFVQAVLLFLAFTVRNNAYYYPFIGGFAFILSKQSIRVKIAGVIMPLLLIIPFIIHTRNAAFKMTGTHQFSLFTGWQLANNALYTYTDLDIDPDDLPSAQSRKLDSLSKTFYSQVTPAFSDILHNYVGNYFIRQRESPLKTYIRNNYKIKNEYDEVVMWGKASADFEEYGKYLIKQNPLAYIKDYVLLNSRFYFLPPLEKLEEYNLGMNDVESIAQKWFNFKSRHISAVSRNVQGTILFLFPSLFLFINICLLGCSIWLLLKKGFKDLSASYNRSLIMASLFMIANFIFCITATIIVFRYEVFPLIIGATYSILLVEAVDPKFNRSETPALIPEI